MRKRGLRKVALVVDDKWAQALTRIESKIRKVGHPSRVPGVATKPRSIRATDAEWAAWNKAASDAGAPVGDWLRVMANKKAGRL